MRPSAEKDCHARSLSGTRFHVELGLCVLAQGSHDQGAELARLGPLHALGQTDTVVRNDDTATIAGGKAVQGDGAAIAADERVLERVREQLVDHQPGRHRHVHRHRIGVDLEIEPDALDSMRVHHRGNDFAQVHAQIDLIPISLIRQQLIDQPDRVDAPGEAVERRGVDSPHCVPCLDADQRRYHLQVVLDAVLNLQKQRVLLANPLRQLFTKRLPLRTDVNQRDQPEGGRPIVILDDIGIGIGKCRLAPGAFDLECADAVL
jgi:hypothetical protein